MPRRLNSSDKCIDATVTSKGQVTLPKELRERLHLHQGSRIRFSIPAHGPARLEPVLYELEDVWKIADQNSEPGSVMTFEEMNQAKERREW